jgi:hypothetical protein
MTAIISKLSQPRIWFRGLLAAFIGGGATALTADQGIVLANRLGAQVDVLSLKALGIVFLSAGIYNAALYLKQSPRGRPAPPAAPPPPPPAPPQDTPAP